MLSCVSEAGALQGGGLVYWQLQQGSDDGTGQA